MGGTASMHVLMSTDSVGGVWTYALDLARATSGLGVRYTLACVGPAPDAAQRRRAEELSSVSVEVLPGRLEWMADAWGDVEAAGQWLSSLAAREQPDVVHLNSFCCGAAGFGAPVLAVAHSCVLSWWEAVRKERAPGGWDEYRRRVETGLAGIDELVAPSAAMLGAIRRHYETAPAGRVIHNGRGSPGPGRERGAPLIACVGRVWDEAKNARAVAEAAAGLAWPCAVAGEAAAPDGGRAAFENVDLLGRRSEAETWDLLRRASVLAHPARYEPFGLAPLEAALSGCALVLGDIDSLREVWGDAAMFVDPEDVGALRESLRRLIEDERLRLEMAARARRRAQRYSLESLGHSYTSLYAELIARRAHRRPTLTG